MPDLKLRIDTAVKSAMRDRDKPRLGTLRMITAALKQKEVDERIELDDQLIIGVLDKLAKQHRDSITQFRQAGREDLVAKETGELEVVLEFLPQPLGEDEIAALVRECIAATGAGGMQDMGKVMGMLKPRVQGRADMGRVSAMVKEQLA